MPSGWEIDFVGIRPSHVRASGIHRFLSNWFGEGPEEHLSAKNYSIWHRADHADGVTVEVRCVDDRLADRLAAIPQGLPVQFGVRHPQVARVSSPPRCSRRRTWEELSEYRGTTQWRLHFRTPTVLRHGQIDQPWPAPHPVLRGLQRTWSAAGPTLPTSFDDTVATSLAVTGADIRTEHTALAPQPLHGATGMVEWTWAAPETAERAAVVERLLGLAEFTGIGSYTQHGLGSVAVAGRRVAAGRIRAV